MTMGNDSKLVTGIGPYELTAVSPLFPDIVQCMQIQVLEIKKSMPSVVRPDATC
jgi:hypothetical protein